MSVTISDFCSKLICQDCESISWKIVATYKEVFLDTQDFTWLSDGDLRFDHTLFMLRVEKTEIFTSMTIQKYSTLNTVEITMTKSNWVKVKTDAKSETKPSVQSVYVILI